MGKVFAEDTILKCAATLDELAAPHAGTTTNGSPPGTIAVGLGLHSRLMTE
jgi:hypothetical protein